MIQIQNLTKQYGSVCATDITELSIEKGEIIGLVGNNGAGKTTMFSLILDLIKPDRFSYTRGIFRIHSRAPWME